MCPVDGPVALVPLWQFLQPVMLVWFTFAGVQASVEWHELHSDVVGTCAVGFPAAFTPSWQLVQVPVTCA
jgi:hypothetical protein